MSLLSRVATAGALLAFVAASAPAVVAAAPAADDPVYALVRRCFALRSVATGQYVTANGTGGYRSSSGEASGAERFRMQATALGRYLLYDRDRSMPTDDGAGAAGRTTVPGPTADFVVASAGSDTYTFTSLTSGRVLAATQPGGPLTLADKGTTGDATQFVLEQADGCQTFPELTTDTTGEPSKGATPFGEVRGWMDAIDHMMAFEFIGGSIHCGRPWSPYGAAIALQDCPDHGPNGSSAAIENALSYGDPTRTHTPDGWPSFTGWPTAPSLTHEQVYWKWLERAWRGGQRLMGGVAVDNAQLCELYPLKRNPCNEMEVARLQVKDYYELQDYIDAQFGGPGKGFFRIVTDPFQARKVINDGKLAVFLGMELSRPFGCRLLDDVAQCDKAQIDSEIADMYRRGVRSMQLVNKFDNALVGVAGDGGPTGVVLNSGNRRETGHYWQLETCTTEGADKEQTTQVDVGGDEANFTKGLQSLLPLGEPSGLLPVYPKGPHCNVRGLTDLGERALQTMIDRKMIVDPDHMSVRARNQTLSFLEARRYSGIISTHGWSTPDSFRRIYGLGGLVTPYAGGSTSFAKEWKRNRDFKAPAYAFGFGIGSDIEGFGSQGGPRSDATKNPVTYPFKGLDPAVTLDRQKSNTRVWDINKDGVAQYGLYPDWIEDLRKIAGDAIVEDLAKGAENYIDMWERADGVPAEHCTPARQRLTPAGMGSMKLGATNVALLRAAGQPLSRPGLTWTYCSNARDGRPAGKVRTVLTPDGRVGLIASTSAEHRIGGVGRGSTARRLPRTRRLSATLRTAPAGRSGARYVYAVRRGRVTGVAVASRAVARSSTTLRKALRSAGLR